MSDSAHAGDVKAGSATRLRRWLRRLAWFIGAVAVVCLVMTLSGLFCMHRARKALERHDAASAKVWLQRADRFFPQTAESHFLVARVSRRLGDPEGLRRHLKQAQAAGFPPGRLEREWVLAQAQAGMLKQAEPYLQGMLLNPGEDGPEILAAFINGFAHHYQFQRAFSFLEAWEQDYPDDAEPHLMRGKLHQRWKNYPAAEESYRAALARDEDLFDARVGLATVLVNQHRYEEAQRHFGVALAAAPHDVNLLSGWADCLSNLGRTDEAQSVFERILQQDDQHSSAWLGLGQIAFADGRTIEAIENFERAMAMAPRRPDLRYAFAQALVAAGRSDEAVEHFEYFDESNSALVRVSRLTSHLVEHPDDLEARFAIGELYMTYASEEEGANWLKTVLAVDPDHCPTHKLLAAYYDRIGQRESAAQHRSHLTNCRVGEALSEHDLRRSSTPISHTQSESP